MYKMFEILLFMKFKPSFRKINLNSYVWFSKSEKLDLLLLQHDKIKLKIEANTLIADYIVQQKLSYILH